MKNRDKATGPNPLRTTAEARLGGTPAEADGSQAMLHELQVHQIELELQNEALRETQIALEEARDRYVDLYDFAPVGYVTLAADGRISAINLTGARLLGAARNTLLRHAFFTFVAPADRDRWHSLFSRLRNQAGAGTIELSLQRGDGTALPAALTCSTQQAAHAVVAIRLAVTDITERKQAEHNEREIQRERIEAAQRLAEISRHLLTVQEDARRRLANDLHDSTSSNLAALAINLDVLARATEKRDWATIATHLADNRALIEDTTAGIRAICADLRPPALDHAGLLPALQAYAAIFSQRTGIVVDLECREPICAVTPTRETVLFRIFQEALTNIGKHARATSVSVELHLDATPSRLTITDNGLGFAPTRPNARPGLGLASMREMAEFAGGSLDIQSSPSGGTRIHATV